LVRIEEEEPNAVEDGPDPREVDQVIGGGAGHDDYFDGGDYSGALRVGKG